MLTIRNFYRHLFSVLIFGQFFNPVESTHRGRGGWRGGEEGAGGGEGGEGGDGEGRCRDEEQDRQPAAGTGQLRGGADRLCAPVPVAADGVGKDPAVGEGGKSITVKSGFHSTIVVVA